VITINVTDSAELSEIELTKETSSLNPVELTTDLAIAWLGNPNTRATSDEVTIFLNRVHEAVVSLARAEFTPVARADPEFTGMASRGSPVSNDRLTPIMDENSHSSCVRTGSSRGIEYTLSWNGPSEANCELFKDLEAVKKRARDLIGDGGVADLAIISDSEKRTVASFQRIAFACLPSAGQSEKAVSVRR
jgi:hypothetical protein